MPKILHSLLPKSLHFWLPFTRKCFDAHDIYAFEPIFKACVPHCHDLEDALKHQLDELVKEGVLDTLPHDWYLVK